MSMSKWHLISPSLQYLTLTNRKDFIVLKLLSLEVGKETQQSLPIFLKALANDRQIQI